MSCVDRQDRVNFSICHECGQKRRRSLFITLVLKFIIIFKICKFDSLTSQYIFLSDRSLVDPTLAAFFVGGCLLI